MKIPFQRTSWPVIPALLFAALTPSLPASANAADHSAAVVNATVPSPPAEFAVIPADDGLSARITWKASANNGGSPITGYDTLRSNPIHPENPSGVMQNTQASSYTWDNLYPGQTYTFTIAAQNAVGFSQPLARTVVMPDNLALPGTPVALKITPTTDGLATISWVRPATHGEPPITAYNVKADGAGAQIPPWGIDVSGTSYKLKNKLPPGRTIDVQVVAKNAAGGGFPAIKSFTMPKMPPTEFVATASWDGKEADLSWSPPPFTYGPVLAYAVTRTEPGQPWPFKTVLTGTNHTWQDLTPGETYTFTVRARDARGYGPAVEQTLTMPALATAAPSNAAYRLSR